MIKTQNYRLLLCLALFVLAACSGAKKEEAADEGVATVLPDEKNEVTVMTLKRQTFNRLGKAVYTLKPIFQKFFSSFGLK